MCDGHRLIRLLIAARRGRPMRDVATVEAVAGRGLAGDRYASGAGTFSGRAGVFAGDREISIIDADAVALCNRRLGAAFDAAAFRRNLVVSGLDLSRLADRTLTIGGVQLRLLGTAPPCGYLARLIGADVKRGLKGIGGRRAAISVGGVLAVDTPVQIQGAEG